MRHARCASHNPDSPPSHPGFFPHTRDLPRHAPDPPSTPRIPPSHTAAEGSPTLAVKEPTCSEDFWSPAFDLAGDVRHVDDYGAVSNIPNHDGTDVF
eukprot:212947-Chlamydomonas_euryale.AAC.1